MDVLLRPVKNRYRRWMNRWEDDLCSRATDRIVRPFELGLDWAERWPGVADLPRNGENPIEWLKNVNQHAINNSELFFGYEKPTDFKLRPDNWLEFQSAAPTPHPANDRVRALWFPARNPRKAV